MKKHLLISLLLLPCLAWSQSPELVVPTGHAGPASALGFFPFQGKNFVLTGGYDNTAKLWNLAGKEIRTFRGHTGLISAISGYSGEEKEAFLLSGSYDGTAKTWSLGGQEIHTFEGHRSDISAVAISPDGAYIVTGSSDSTAILWNRRSGEKIHTLDGHHSEVFSLAFSPDGRRLLTGSYKQKEKWEVGTDGFGRGIARLFSLESGEELWANDESKGAIENLAFSEDGKFILLGVATMPARLLNSTNGKTIRTYEGFEGLTHTVAFSPSGKQALLAGLAEGQSRACQWERESGQLLRSFQGPAGWAEDMAFSPPTPGAPDGGQYILISTEEGIKLWDWSGRVRQVYDGHATSPSALAVSADGLLMGCNNATVKRWDLPAMRLQNLQGLSSPTLAVAFSSDDSGGEALAGSLFGNASAWDKDGQQSRQFEGNGAFITALALSPPAPDGAAAGKYLLFGTEENTIELWDWESGKKIRTIDKGIREQDPRMMIRAETVESMNERIENKDAPSKDFFFSNDFGMPGEDSLRTKAEGDGPFQATEPLNFGTQLVSAVAFSPNDGGKYLLSGDWDNTAELWDRDTGEKLESFDGHTGEINAVAFSPDGYRILTASEDGTARLWARDGRLIRILSGHTAGVTAIAFSPDGRSILTAGDDNSLKLWDATAGELIQSLEGQMAHTLAFSADSRFIFSGGQDNTTRIWDAQSGQALASLIALDSTDWAVTTPSGLFDASPGAMRLMHYVIGMEIIELEQLKERYYEPGLLQKLLGYSDEPIRSVAGFDTVALFPAVVLELDSQAHQLQVELRPRNGGIGPVSVFINNKEVLPDANPPQGFDKQRSTRIRIDLGKYSRYFLQDSLNTISVRAYNEAGWLRSPNHTIAYRPRFVRSRGDTDSSPSPFIFRGTPKPALYALIIGTSNYSGEKLDLKYPDKDARAMAQAIGQAGEQLFPPDSVFLSLLTTDATDASQLPTKDNIRQAFEKIKKQAKAEDVLLVYLSGHGVTYGDAERAQFYYLSQDISSTDLSDSGIRQARTISSAELTRWINDIPAQKQVMILDACNSGKLVEILDSGQKALNSTQVRALDRMQGRTGMYVLAGSAADKSSYEANQFGQGLLTYSLLEGMSGLALREKRYVDVMALFQYARDKVPELALAIERIQTPMLAFPGGGASFDIGIVNEQVDIPLAPVKPVFIRNTFLDEDRLSDHLELTARLEAHFREISARGADAGLVYVDIPDFPNAYTIRGLYRLEGGAVKLKARLFKGRQALGDIASVGADTRMDALVEEVLRQAFNILQQQ